MLIEAQADASLRPALATSWDVVNDPANPSITLHLRQGVKFIDGTDFNAQAVKWNFDMMKTAGSTTAGSTTNWKSVEVLDNYTIRVNLKTWQNTALNTFATAACFMVSPASYEKNGPEWTNTNIVGTAPFMQAGYQRDVSITFKRNPNYWEQGKPYLDGITHLFVSDALTAEALFKSGGGEVLQSYSDLMTNRFRTAGYKLIPSQVGGATSMWPDSANADSPWSKVLVRQAAEYALDKESLSRTFGYGNWTPAYQNQSPVSPAYDSNLVPRKYDPAKARQVLADAGYPGGFKTTLIVSPFGVTMDIAVAIKSMWDAVGIKTEMQFPQVGAFTGMLTGGQWRNGVLVGAGAGSANPLVGWSATLNPASTWFSSMKRPDGIADLYTAALNAPSLDRALAQKVEDALFNDATIITLWFTTNYWVVTDEVMEGGLGTRDLFAWFSPQDMWLKK
jgi:peptide/nickel transport system substrate-binding protein